MSRLPSLSLLLGALLLSGCTIELQHDLPEQDANDIYVLLNENSISARKEREAGGNTPTYMISVAKSDAAQAAKLMREYSLPRPLAKGLSVFSSNVGMVPTQTQERAMMLEASGGEVSNSFNKVDGVLEAKVIVSIPEITDLTQQDKRPVPTAAVFIKYRPTLEGKPPMNETQVRKFTANSVPELLESNVAVLLSAAQPPSADLNAGSQMVDVLGLRMTSNSAATFKGMAAGVGVVVLVIAGLAMWLFFRGGPPGSGGGKPNGRRRPPPEE